MGGLVTPIYYTPLVIGQGGIPLNDMKVITISKQFSSGKLAGRQVYTLTGTKEEKAAYKTAKGIYYKEDATGNPEYLAFPDEKLARGIEYVLNERGFLEKPVTEQDMANNDLLAQSSLSLVDLQKLQILKAMEAGY
jgi:hypothetical protein